MVNPRPSYKSLKRAAIAARTSIFNPAKTVADLQAKVLEKAEELATVSKRASDGTKLGAIMAIQKRFPDAKPKCPNCAYHSTGYDDFIDHLRSIHGASI